MIIELSAGATPPRRDNLKIMVLYGFMCCSNAFCFRFTETLENPIKPAQTESKTMETPINVVLMEPKTLENPI